jgi:hypothetical protein
VRIFGLCVVKNEVDVVKESLAAAIRWCDRIFVLDNGSDDGTWDVVQELSRASPRIVLVGRDARPFDSGIRDDIFRRFAQEARAGDWWCILDADEFHVDDPREFLARVPSRFQCVWKQELTYYFTEEDLARYRSDPDSYAERFPILERLRYYRSDWSEFRFFRHPAADDVGIPWNSPTTYEHRIRIKHFKYRSPEQIQKRLETRREGIQRGIFPHESRSTWASGHADAIVVMGPADPDQIPDHWEERVVPTAGLHFDAGDGVFAPGKPWTPPTDDFPSLTGNGGGTPRASSLARILRRLRKKARSLLVRSP